MRFSSLRFLGTPVRPVSIIQGRSLQSTLYSSRLAYFTSRNKKRETRTEHILVHTFSSVGRRLVTTDRAEMREGDVCRPRIIPRGCGARKRRTTRTSILILQQIYSRHMV